MKRNIIFLLLAAALLVYGTSAAGLALSAGQKDYYFVVGDTAQIPILVSNTYDHAIPGMMRVTTTESTKGLGLSMSSSYSQSQSYTAPQGETTITVDGGTSNTEKSVVYSISFDYNDPTPQSQVLEDITVHFVADPSGAKNTKQQVVSQGVTPNQGNSGLSSSSYQYIQQVMQQTSGMSPRQSLQESQMPQDTAALKQQLQAEQAREQANTEEFLKNLNNDTTYRAVNQSLTDQGYAVSKMDPNPQSGNTGTFSSVFSKATGEQVSVSGSLRNGTSTEITEQTTAPVLPPGPFLQNSSYRESGQGLENEAYQRSVTRINNTPAGITVNQSYQDEAGKQAHLNGTSSGMNVTSVAVEKEEVSAGYLLPVIAAIIIAVLVLTGYLVYRKYKKNRALVVPAPVTFQPKVVDYRNEAELLLREAEKQASRQLYREAYGTAGQALRLFLSYRFGTGAEMTNTEVIDLVTRSGREIAGIGHLLDRCSLVEFAKAEPGPGEFVQFSETIRNVLRAE